MTDRPMLSLPSIPLPYYIESGRTRYVPGEQHPNRRGIGLYDLIVVEAGLLYIGEESVQWEVGPGQMLLLHPDRYHYAVRPCEEETRFYWLHFRTAPAAEPADSPGHGYAIRLPQYWSLPSPSHTYQQFDRLLQLATERRSRAFWQEQSIFLELLKQLDEAQSEHTSSRSLAVAEMVETYLKQNYQSNISSRELSQGLHFHYNYLTRCMKEIYGVSPLDYLMQIRLEQAKLLLIKTDWSIARIAEHVGFEYAPYFTRCFTDRNGVAPLRFRRQFYK